MKPYYQDTHSTLYCGDALVLLKEFPSESVNMCVTSPPYYGLREYGMDDQIGLESTPVEYVEKLVSVFREMRRVLRGDGTLWLNLGDSYAGSGKGIGSDHGKAVFSDSDIPKTDWERSGLKSKDLIGIPWRVAFALQADGWWLRQDIIWSKPNPMPESVTDRCTKSHEYLFLLSKSAKYYYDAEAIKEAASWNTHERQARARIENKSNPTDKINGIRPHVPSNWDISKGDGPHGSFHKDGRRKLGDPGSGIKNNVSFDAAMAVMPDTRNKHSVWEITTQPYKEAHFATYPEALVKPCILAGCPAGGGVLDMFAGSGTTLSVAKQLNRKSIGIELSPEYCKLAQKRIESVSIPMELSL